jgi:hypothetical protein
MVNFKRLTDRAKETMEKRGGKDALKDDMQELRNIAKSKGSIKEKANAAKDALKDPGRRGADASRAEGTQTARPPGEKAARPTAPTEPPTAATPPASSPADTPENPRTK